MKKLFKNPILTFILGIVLTLSIGVLASTIAANSISYGNGTVKDALDELYSNVGKVDLDRLSFSSNSYQGEKVKASKTSLTLSKGNYIIIGIEAFPSPVSSNPGSTSFSTTGTHPKINQSSEVCEVLGDRETTTVPSTTYGGSYQRLYVQSRIWKCSLPDTTQTVEMEENTIGSSDTNLPLTVLIEAIKLD